MPSYFAQLLHSFSFVPLPPPPSLAALESRVARPGGEGRLPRTRPSLVARPSSLTPLRLRTPGLSGSIRLGLPGITSTTERWQRPAREPDQEARVSPGRVVPRESGSRAHHRTGGSVGCRTHRTPTADHDGLLRLQGLLNEPRRACCCTLRRPVCSESLARHSSRAHLPSPLSVLRLTPFPPSAPRQVQVL